MAKCSVCRQEIIITDTTKSTIKNPKKRRKYKHDYCHWRINQFWRSDVWSVISFFILNFICFIFLILAGTIGQDVILQNVAFLVLVWTWLFSLWLFWLNYTKMVLDCCDYYDNKKRTRKKKTVSKD